MSAPVTIRAATQARTQVSVVFALNGLLFATWVSRIPEVRSELALDNSGLGLLLLAISAGSLLALPLSGGLIQRHGTAFIVRSGALATLVGYVFIMVGVSADLVPVVALGLFVYGIGTGTWDVAMNVEGVAVEQSLGRSIMPRFHAAFSLGTVAGAGAAALVIWLGVPLGVHLALVGILGVVVAWWSCASFLPVEPPHEEQRPARRAWREPRTLLIGLMVMAMAFTEGTANDWLAVALVDGHDVEHWMGVAGFAVFVSAMTLGRVAGTLVLDRFGRGPVLWGTMGLAAAGVLMIVYGGSGPIVVAGILLWGLGASLGFPVGMSAAADDPAHAAARVAVVSTIGYSAFLAGPPLLGFLADHVGTLDALLAVAILMIPSALVVPATRERAR